MMESDIPLGRSGVHSVMAKQSDQYSAKETARRVKAAVQGAFNTQPKPLKSMTPKRAKAQGSRKAKR
jgi:hypothetical protein